MSELPTTLPDSVSLLRRVDALCLRFEDDWQANRRPSLEDCLATLPAEEQPAALVELLLVEWSARSGAGETLDFEDYARRFAAQPGALEKARRQWQEAIAEMPSLVPNCPLGPLAPCAGDVAASEGKPPGPGALSCSADEAATRSDPPGIPPGPRAYPAVIGPYRLLEQLGSGGMGVVYKARHEQLHHLVALKVVRAGAHATPEDRERFRREGETLARLQHPNVVHILHFDEYEGQPYFVMELLAGNLARKLAGPRPEREAALLVEGVARGVHAAHRLGIIHRDLKPGNVLFDDQGTPKVSDFGLAKLLEAEGSPTVTGHILGTPSYMAPEQARGEAKRVGPAADVYALGAILYECLTGRPPFKGDSTPQTLELVRAGRLQEPSGLRPGLSRELEAACLKCLAREPAQRYPSAEALADDLRCWLEGRPMQVRPPGPLRRLGLALRHRPRQVAAVGLGLVLFAGVWVALVLGDPDRAIKRIEAALARGEPQVLIAEAGRPAWSRCSVGERDAKVEVGRDGTLFIKTWSVALLELVRDPQSASYRLSAEVRHEATRPPGEVGIYVGHQKYRGEAHSFLLLSFNDMEGNNVYFGPHLYREAGRSPEPECAVAWPAAPLQPGGLGQTDWRRMALEVRPGEVRVVWEGKPVGAWTAAQLVKQIRNAQEVESRNADPDPLARLPAAFAPRGALGLYVKVGSAYFRNVVVEPLNLTE